MSLVRSLLRLTLAVLLLSGQQHAVTHAVSHINSAVTNSPSPTHEGLGVLCEHCLGSSLTSVAIASAYLVVVVAPAGYLVVDWAFTPSGFVHSPSPFYSRAPPVSV
jgi:hypothetical protein